MTHLRDLVAIAEKGGLRRAARHLGLAQPAITRSIRELEHELGATFFERTTTGMNLTPVGAAFCRR
ncbi:LysR family transcriptional regulator, partial [Sphingomonas sp.]|uniref:helix-turn-helix domain-containing protein n=1 Tax=Sphingomonas sp. TaxID=28214 RepID=UPI0025F214FE